MSRGLLLHIGRRAGHAMPCRLGVGELNNEGARRQYRCGAAREEVGDSFHETDRPFFALS